ncbi:MAG: CCA tRNA nucleotidyltransferase [Rhodospirillales bacterium]
MTESVKSAPWLRAPETLAVLDALEAGGMPARFVGGCVRDALAGRKMTDVDFATPAPPEKIMELLAAAGLRCAPTGLKHGTVTAVSGGSGFEITTLRVDVKTDGRHAEVAFTDDWDADAARRDFTFNAMSADREGRVYDPFGGAADLAAGRVRFVGDARARVREDYLRVLRFFRFTAHFGAPPADTDALAACREAAALLDSLARERIRVELIKLFAAENPAEAAELMLETGAWGALDLPDADVKPLQGLLAAERAFETAPKRDPLLRLAAFCVVTEKDARVLAKELKMSNAEAARLAALSAAPSVHPRLNKHDLAAALHREGADVILDRAMMGAAQDSQRARGHKDAWERVFAAVEDWRRNPRVFPLRGEDVTAMGVPAGPRVGEILTAVEAWWVKLAFTPTREECLKHAAEMVEQ